jgi:microcystin-dependent protein
MPLNLPNSQDFSLAGAGATLGATTITLKSFTDIDGNLLAMSDFGDIGFGTMEPGNSTQEEQICFTGVVQNSNGTATLSGVKNVSFLYPYTQTSGLAKTHAGSTVFVISNTSGFYDKLTSKSDDETITGTWSFDAVPNTAQDPVAGADIARRSWVLSVVNGGAVSTDSVVVSGTAGETLVAGNLVYLKAADGLWYKTDADDSTTCVDVQLGIAQGIGSIGVAITSGVLIEGVDNNQSGLVAGAIQYVSNTAGAISATAGTNSVTVGNAKSTTSLYFAPNFNGLVTANQKAALAGLSGTPSATNLYMTEQSLTGTISPYVGRTSPTGFLLCDGTAYSRSTYSRLFAVIAPSKVFTVTIATPAVFSSTSHGLVAGDKISLTTTGALPTGLAANTDYYVISSGLTANAFEVSASRGGSAVNTTGSQSGVHTLYATNYGKGDGSTTFNVPDMRGFTPYGYKSSDANFDVLNVPNTYVGEKTHTLITAEMPAHTHSLFNANPSGPNNGFTAANPTTGTSVTSSTGGDGAHNNMPPYVVTNWIIKT